MRFFNGKWLEKYDPTIEDTYRRQVEVYPPPNETNQNPKPVSILLEIFDTAGQEEYQTLRDHHIQQGQGFIVVYSIIDPESYFVAGELIEKIKQLPSEKALPIVLVANKIDLKNSEEGEKLTREQGTLLAEKYGIPFFETSALENTNVKEAFSRSAQDIYLQNLPPPSLEEPKKKKKKGGCNIL